MAFKLKQMAGFGIMIKNISGYWKMITLRDMKKADGNIGKVELSKENMKVFAEKFKDMELFKNLDDDGICSAVIMLYFIWMQENENERLWKDFKEDIKHKSRFFPESELLKKVDNILDYASVELSKGTVLYRAREYTESDSLQNKELIAFYQKLNEFFPHFKLQPEDIGSESAMNLVWLALAGDADKTKELYQKVKEVADEESPFWGFKEIDCDAPPKEFAKAGRANSVGISFLYAATDKRTAIMEMRPQIGQCFNICNIEICKDIRIFDFTYTAGELKENEYMKSGDLYAISKEFSCPNYGNVNDYFPTQYLCEYLRQKGFDGIRYKSAVSLEGINVIIFDTDKANRAYKIVESRVYNVKNLDIQFEQFVPLELQNLN